MTLSPTLPQAAVDLVVAVLVRLLLPALAGDTDAAKALALAMLAEYQPHTIRELGIAGEIVGLGLDSLNALAESAQPGLAAERITVSRRWACSLSRAGHQAQRRLEALQRARRQGAQAERENSSAPLPERPTTPGQPAQPRTAPAETAPTQTAPIQTAHPDTALQESAPHAAPKSEIPLSQAEATFVGALAHLNLMKARHKGPPPPHSQAAQQIQAQQRIVDAARMKLELQRKATCTAEPQLEPVRAAA